MVICFLIQILKKFKIFVEDICYFFKYDKTLNFGFVFSFDNIYSTVEKRKISYFGLARNLIQHLISPNQDDLSYSPRTFISGQQIGYAAKPSLFGWRTPTSADVTLAVLQ